MFPETKNYSMLIVYGGKQVMTVLLMVSSHKFLPAAGGSVVLTSFRGRCFEPVDREFSENDREHVADLRLYKNLLKCSVKALDSLDNLTKVGEQQKPLRVCPNQNNALLT